MEEQRKQTVDQVEIRRSERRAAALREQEKRLVRLYAYGEVDDGVITEQAGAAKRERQLFEARLKELQGPGPMSHVDSRLLTRACGAVAEWIEDASAEDRRTALEALQVAIIVTRESASLTGVLPVEVPPFITGEQS